MPNPVTSADIADRWRPLTDAEDSIAQAMLSDAWAIVLVNVPDIEERLTAGTLNPGIVRAVLCAMVLRVMRNPEGKRSEAIDDYSWTRDSTVASGLLYLMDSEITLLGATRAHSAFTIAPRNPSWTGGCGSYYLGHDY